MAFGISLLLELYRTWGCWVIRYSVAAKGYNANAIERGVWPWCWNEMRSACGLQGLQACLILVLKRALGRSKPSLASLSLDGVK
jgi:hypothetical protein